MWKWIGATTLAVAVALSVGCAQPPPKLKPVIEDKIDRDALIGDRDGRVRASRNEADEADRARRTAIGPPRLPDEARSLVRTED